MKNKQIIPNAEIIIAMLIFGTIGIFRRFIFLPSASIAMVRGAAAVLSLLVVVFLKRKKPDYTAVKKKFAILAFSGCFIGLNWMLLFEAFNYTTVMTATLCCYMAPVIVIAVSAILFREKLTGKTLLCISGAVTGMVLLSGVLSGGNSVGNIKGILLALGSAVFYAGVIILNKFAREVPIIERTIVQMFFASLAVLPFALFGEKADFIHADARSLILLAILGVIHTGMTYALYFAAIGELPSQKVAFYSYIDPVTALIISVFILKEKTDALTLTGALLIIISLIAYEFGTNHRRRKKLST